MPCDSGSMTTSTKSLEQKIETVVEQLVREHLAACEAAAAAAIREGFRRAAAPASRPESPGKKPRAKHSRRRTPEELAELSAKLYEAVVAHPGETMMVLAQAVGTTSEVLNRPARLLRKQGQVRSVGRQNSTRYFPMGK